MNKINIKINFLSDWAFLCGKNYGGLDNTLIRDENYFPYIPGKTIKGIFREAFEEIAPIMFFDNNPEKKVKEIFGKSKEPSSDYKKNGIIIFSNAEINNVLKEELFKLDSKERKFILSEISYTVPRVTIDKETKMSEEKSLAFIEMGRKYLEFIFSIRKIENEKFTQEERNIINKLCGYIKRMGSMRTRGKGKCKIEMINGGEK